MSAGTFARALAFVLAHEGRYDNDPRDPGGETKWGIAARFYSPSKIESILGRRVAIKDLSQEDAARIYRRDYWDRLRCDEYPWPLALAVMDCAVVPGQGAAAMCLQREAGAMADGVIGPATHRAVAQSVANLGAVELGRRVARARLRWFEGAIKKNPGLSVFRAGWTARCVDVGWAAAETPEPNIERETSWT